MLEELRKYATHYKAFAYGAETDPDLKTAFNDIREIKSNVVYPFILRLYHDYQEGHLLQPDFLEIVRMIESYLFRRGSMWIASRLA